MQKGNKEVIESKLAEHFAKIRSVVDMFEQKTRSKLETHMQDQSAKLMDV